MKKIAAYIIRILIGIIILLGICLAVFLIPLFQADEMLAQIRIENVVADQCYLVSVELLPDNDESKRQIVLSRQQICGDFIGLGYEYALPEKSFALMKKPGIVITNLVAFEKKQKNQTGNVPIGRYEIELVESLREHVATLLKKTPLFKSITYDIRVLLKNPKAGAVISYKLEPLRQQVIVECTGCED